ncbi:MAG TPA: cytochrome c biogenesis protein CcdA [Phycisphaerae bacterium]|nr:cytochrome c biogenesis protein CcdA [Phycisphaerae bacterium]
MTAVPASVSAGSSGKLQISINIPAGYHIQSAHPLDPSLIATKVTISPAPGISFDPVVYPPAQIVSVSPLMSSSGQLSVYENNATITVPFAVLSSAVPGPRHITVSLLTQMCNDQTCLIPQTQTLSGDLVISAGNSSPPATAPAESVPIISTPQSANSSLTPQQQAAIAAINARPYHVAYTRLPLWLLVIFALLGGLILNLMPCVLPVVPLKVLSLLQQAQGDRRRAILHSLVFALGVISLFAFLALAMGAYRAITSHELIYGMQFSSPVFLITMALIVLVLALSMLNVWTIQTPRAVYAVDKPRTGWIGSYSMGLLATLLATPCSAPYLGPMLQWALVQAVPVMVIFLMLIGVGMATPYILLAAFPSLLEHLPRPGRWMEGLKMFLGVVMLGVAAFLLFSVPTPHQAVIGCCLALILIVACWIWGRIPTPSMEPAKVFKIRAGALAWAVICGVVVLVGFGGLNTNENNNTAPGSSIITGGTWQNFSLARLDVGLQQGHPVIVDFTAVWCINCHFVEAAVLNTQPVKSAFKESNAVLLRADLDDPVVMAFLSKLGGRSIPFLAIFSPDNLYRPAVLQDIYSASAVIQAVHAAKS